jgi:hypothetical protein
MATKRCYQQQRLSLQPVLIRDEAADSQNFAIVPQGRDADLTCLQVVSGDFSRSTAAASHKGAGGPSRNGASSRGEPSLAEK